MPVQVLKHPAIRSVGKMGSKCPVCNDDKRSYLFVIRGLPVVRCPGCGLISLHPFPDPVDCHTFYGCLSEEQDPRLLWTDGNTEREAAQYYVAALHEKGLKQGKLLLIAPPEHPFAAKAMKQGFSVELHVSLPDIENGLELGNGFDGVVIIYQLEKAEKPLDLLRKIHAALRPGGVLMVSAPSIDNWPARFFGDQWTEWRPENKYYFDTGTIHSILLKSGFAVVRIEPEKRLYTLQHIFERSVSFPRTLLTRTIGLLYKIFPPFLRNVQVRLSTSRILVTAERSEPRSDPLLSVVLPVYNEKNTFSTLITALLEKESEGIDREIIIIESNSTDGTKELVNEYRNHPEVKLVFQDRPRGKGNAVRVGFEHATGDIILIQDADLEYDLNDYDTLLDHLIHYRALFVLGARHGGDWKMRSFASQWSLATLLNFGHVFFTKLLNLLYRQSMTDPFTMFKVFRRDCVNGIEFECNRFDFDHELVIKLVRKGYKPLEVPVNYWSRSFKEGKKVRMFRDPLSWLWVNFKFRLLPMSYWQKK